MKTEERSRHTVWMEDTVWQRVQEHYKSDGCLSLIHILQKDGSEREGLATSQQINSKTSITQSAAECKLLT